MEITGKIIVVLPKRTGMSKRTGNGWVSQDYVIETIEQHSRKCCFRLFGEERIAAANIQVGEELTVQFNIEAQEFNGRWYNEIRAYNVSRTTALVIQPQHVSQQADPDPFGRAPVDDLPSFSIEEEKIQLAHLLESLAGITDKTLRLTKMRDYNKALEQSVYYQSIINDVMNEVYRQYAKRYIDMYENAHKSVEDMEIVKAKYLLDKNPQKAASFFNEIGACHFIWSLQKKILKEKYNIDWYSSSELSPDLIID